MCAAVAAGLVLVALGRAQGTVHRVTVHATSTVTTGAPRPTVTITRTHTASATATSLSVPCQSLLATETQLYTAFSNYLAAYGSVKDQLELAHVGISTKDNDILQRAVDSLSGDDVKAQAALDDIVRLHDISTIQEKQCQEAK